MIPSTTNKLLVTEDWKKIYQSYRNADFKSYDFETLRRTMITYLRENYPEDFNDYIESSEYIALIDLIAYLGQNLSFRIDLNARENFLETAERRESVLRLARLINYNGKRNVPANGFLKIVSVSTTDTVIDANGINLANQIVSWNDPTNTNWYQQFVAVVNSAMPGNFVFGRPYDKATINGIDHQQYRISSANADVPIYGFNANINGTNMNFEIVSSLFADKTYVYEEPPVPANQFSFIYKNDSRGNSSSNTGFFVHFRQGTLSVSNFNIDSPVPNELITIDTPDINNTDVWLWQRSASGNYSNLWTKVDDLIGNNIIYNSINKDIRNIYSVLTRENDAIDLNFSDGSFGDLPKGQFSLFYRQSNGLSYVIKPGQLSNISVNIPYVNKAGQNASLSLVVSLQDTVSNSIGSETNGEIKTKAPQNYYVQNRMVTAEDYNIAPLTAGGDILKIKSINRVSSGISKYFELSDVSGQYSKTNIFANDGIIYKDFPDSNFEFNFVNQNEVLGVIKNQLTPVVASEEMRSYYIDKFPRIATGDSTFVWTRAQKTTNQNKGYFTVDGLATAVGSFTENSLRYITNGALVKFVPPEGYFFLPTYELTSIQSDITTNYFWSTVVFVTGDGFNNAKGLLDNGTGPITLTGNVPSGAIVQEIIPKFANVLSTGIQAAVVDICLGKRNLGLSFDAETRAWYIITDSNLDLNGSFSLSYQKDASNISKDASWLISFEWTGRNYKVRYRVLDYIFESVEETAFFVDKTKKNYDFVNDTIIKDQIKILSINDSPRYITTVTNLVDIPFTTSASTSNVVVTVTVNTSTQYKNTGTISYPVAAQTGTVAASVVYLPSVTGAVSLDVKPSIANTIGTAASGSKFISFSTLTTYYGPLAPLTPSYWIFNGGIGSIGYTRVLAQTWQPTPTPIVTLELETAMGSSVSAGTTVVFVPITVTTSSYTLTSATSVVITTSTAWSWPGATYSVPYSITGTNHHSFVTTGTSGPIAITTSGSISVVNTFTFNNAEAHQALSLFKDYQWQVNSSVIEADGYINPNKVKVSLFDANDDGQIDDPDAFENIVNTSLIDPQTGFSNKFVYFQRQADGLRYNVSSASILAYPTEDDVPEEKRQAGALYYFYNPSINVVKSYLPDTLEFVLEPDYFAFNGRQGLKFHYLHNSGQDRRIDPSKTNLIDIYLLTKTYDIEYRNWLITRSGTEPLPPTSQSLEENYAAALEPIKSISDELVFQPTKYKVLFGDLANSSLQGTFKAVRNSAKNNSDNDLKTRILMAIERFFSIENWEFGQTFHFTELATYVMNELTPDITNFVVIPKSVGSFGSLYEVTCQSNEIFVNGATVNDIEIIDAITASELKAISSVVNSTTGG